MSKKIAFDLDGVLVPDCDIIPGLGGLGEFYRLAESMRPTFKPTGEWAIITGRPAWARVYTEGWVNKHFADSQKPAVICHEIGDEPPCVYKEKMILELGITVFVESEEGQVQYLREKLPSTVTVYHFDQYVAGALEWDRATR